MIRKTTVLLLAIFLAGTLLAYGQGEKEDVVKVLRTSNKAQINRYVCEALPLKNVNPFNIIAYFHYAVAREEGGCFSFVEPDGVGGYIVVICPEYQLEPLRKLAKELDIPGLTSAQGSAITLYRMKHRAPSADVVNMLGRYYGGANPIVIPDNEIGSVALYDPRTGVDAMLEALEEIFDFPLRQVEMAIKIYEVDVSRDAAIGLDYAAWKNGPGKSLLSAQTYGGTFNGPIGNKGSYTGRMNSFLLDYPSAFFDFLESKGKAEAKTDTKIVGTNHNWSIVESLEEVRYWEVETVVDREKNVTPSQAYPRVLLGIKPTIGDESIAMEVEWEVVSVRGISGTNKPTFAEEFGWTTVTAEDGEEVITGGVTRERVVRSTTKIPLLGSLPVIGWVFGGENDMIKKSMVVQAITPRLLDGGNANASAADNALKRDVQMELVKVLP